MYVRAAFLFVSFRFALFKIHKNNRLFLLQKELRILYNINTLDDEY